MKGIKNGVDNAKQAIRLQEKLRPEQFEAVDSILNTELNVQQSIQQKAKII
jgi:hypothetical protein